MMRLLVVVLATPVWAGCSWAPAPPSSPPPTACAATGCELSWLSDSMCDSTCNNAACNYDAGDCSSPSPPPSYLGCYPQPAAGAAGCTNLGYRIQDPSTCVNTARANNADHVGFACPTSAGVECFYCTSPSLGANLSDNLCSTSGINGDNGGACGCTGYPFGTYQNSGINFGGCGRMALYSLPTSNSGRRLAANQIKFKTVETAKLDSAPVVVKMTSAAKTEPPAAAFDIGRSLVGGTVARAYSDDDIARLLITQHGRSMQSSSTPTQTCSLSDINLGSCGGLQQRTPGCWVDTYLAGQDVCCSASSDDCCEMNAGALTGVIIGGVVGLALLIASCVACCVSACCACCPCNKHNPKKLAAAGGGAAAAGGQVQVELEKA